MDCLKSCAGDARPAADDGFEVARIPKTTFSCSLCEDYAARQAAKPLAVMSCEGACLRGEIARQAANILSHALLPDQSVRICLGGAFTKNTGQRGLVRNAPRLVAVEGCPTRCATRMMQGVLEGLAPEVFIASALCEFDAGLFGVEELPAAEIRRLAGTVAERIATSLAGA
jgi:uncharacterized metal-binding protein